jgi:hypothetical protein
VRTAFFTRRRLVDGFEGGAALGLVGVFLDQFLGQLAGARPVLPGDDLFGQIILGLVRLRLDAGIHLVRQHFVALQKGEAREQFLAANALSEPRLGFDSRTGFVVLFEPLIGFGNHARCLLAPHTTATAATTITHLGFLLTLIRFLATSF